MDKIREIVGGPKNRYRESGYNLDLTYITPRLIAMAFPASGIQKIYRNSVDDIVKFFTQNHGTNYMIINLSGRVVNQTKLQNVLNFDWEDHQVPPLETLFEICDKMAQFLQLNEKKVVAIHCNHGKGRTGTIVCCFLIYCQMFKDTYLAKQFYAKKRFQKEQGLGVTQPCQVQYIKYFQQVLNGSKNLPRVVTIKKLSFVGAHKYSTLYFKVRSIIGNRTLLSTKKSKTNALQNKLNQQQLQIKLFEQKYFAGDAKLQIKAPNKIGSSTVATYSFNTAFLSSELQSIRINLEQISPFSIQKSENFDPDFHVIVYFKQICDCNVQLAFHLRCQKCRDLLMDQQEKWKKIKHILHRRSKIDQEEMFELLGLDKVKKQNKIVGEQKQQKIQEKHFQQMKKQEHNNPKQQLQ